MKKIEPVTIWSNGESKVAEYLFAKGIDVNLGHSAQFYWGLYTKTQDADGNDIQGEQVSQGNLTMDGTEYQSWDQDDVAWDFVASKLNLTII